MDNIDDFDNFSAFFYYKPRFFDPETVASSPRAKEYNRYATTSFFYKHYFIKYPSDFLFTEINKINNTTKRFLISNAFYDVNNFVEHCTRELYKLFDLYSDKIGFTYQQFFEYYPGFAPTMYFPDILISTARQIDKIETKHLFIPILFHLHLKGLENKVEIPKESRLSVPKSIVTLILKSAPRKIKDKLLFTDLLKPFEQINKLHIFDLKFSTNPGEVMGEKCNSDGLHFLDWSNVTFADGFYYITLPNTTYYGKNNAPFQVIDKNSRKVFNKIKALFLKSLECIRVRLKNGVIIEVINPQQLNDCIILLEHYVQNPKVKEKRLKEPKKLDIIELSNAETRSNIQKFNSIYLNFLVDKQLDKYKVVCAIERRVNTSTGALEQSFIFSIDEDDKYSAIVIENVNPGRASYIMLMPLAIRNKCIQILYNYLGSGLLNKRSAISNQLVDFGLPKECKFTRIVHRDLQDWKFHIEYCLNCP